MQTSSNCPKTAKPARDVSIAVACTHVFIQLTRAELSKFDQMPAMQRSNVTYGYSEEDQGNSKQPSHSAHLHKGRVCGDPRQ